MITYEYRKEENNKNDKKRWKPWGSTHTHTHTSGYIYTITRF